jgi:putative chitinase
MKLQDKYKTLFNSYHINTPLRVAHFMAQIDHESGLKPVSENLNYSKEGLLNTFSKYFPIYSKASEYARQPQKIANLVYANRMGNGNEASGDGWKYRGRGFIQITGKDNYTMLSKDTRIDYLNNPDLLLTEANSLISALWYWNKHNINALADKNDIKGVTRTINGGFNGLADRKDLFNKYYTK